MVIIGSDIKLNHRHTAADSKNDVIARDCTPKSDFLSAKRYTCNFPSKFFLLEIVRSALASLFENVRLPDPGRNNGCQTAIAPGVWSSRTSRGVFGEEPTLEIDAV